MFEFEVELMEQRNSEFEESVARFCSESSFPGLDLSITFNGFMIRKVTAIEELK